MYRDPSKTDWDKFLERLSGNRQSRNFQLKTQEEVESALKELESHLVDAFEFACPLRKIYSRNSPFWSKRLDKLRKKVRRLFNKAKHKKSDIDWQNYKLARKEFKKTLRAAKRKSWLKFIDEVKDLKATAKLNKALAKDPFYPEMLKKEDGSYTKSSEEVVDLLMKTHFPGTRPADTIKPQPIRTPNATDWNLAATIVTNRRLEWAIDSFKPFKSPGNDGIYPIVMQKASSLIMKLMKKILQAILAMGYIPESWREVLVKFIPKQGRAAYDQASSYRPISLTSFVLKTLERMCDRYIRDVILKLRPLHRNQHAYQAGKSVDSALHQVVFNVEKSMEFGKKTLATFLDLEGAFNKVTFEAINAAMRKFGLDRTLIRWIMAMLSNRILSIDLFGAHRAGLADRGCPQGGVLPPILWNMTVDCLLVKLNEAGYLAIGYADDIAILISGAFEEVLSSVMSMAFRIVEEWCSESGLSVNPDKTGLILFTRKRKLLALQMPILFGTHLKLTDKVKYLGVILDNRLEWREHIEERTKKALRIFWQCRTTFGKKWGLKPAVLYWMYRAIVRPILIYGCMVWASQTELRVVQKKMNQVQRLACLSITGVMTSTPTAALEILLSLPPLDLFVKQEAELIVYRLYKGGNWIAQDRSFGHAEILSRLKRKFREVEMPEECQ